MYVLYVCLSVPKAKGFSFIHTPSTEIVKFSDAQSSTFHRCWAKHSSQTFHAPRVWGCSCETTSQNPLGLSYGTERCHSYAARFQTLKHSQRAVASMQFTCIWLRRSPDNLLCLKSQGYKYFFFVLLQLYKTRQMTHFWVWKLSRNARPLLCQKHTLKSCLLKRLLPLSDFWQTNTAAPHQHVKRSKKINASLRRGQTFRVSLLELGSCAPENLLLLINLENVRRAFFETQMNGARPCLVGRRFLVEMRLRGTPRGIIYSSGCELPLLISLFSSLMGQPAVEVLYWFHVIAPVDYHCSFG